MVEALEQETTTKSGILLPDTSKEKPSQGKVVAIGKGKILENGQRGPMDVKVGDIVYFTKYSPDELEVDVNGEKKKYLVVTHSSLLAVQAA